MEKKNKSSIKIIDFCPKCDDAPIVEKNKGNLSIAVSRECTKHQPNFVKTGTGIMVPEEFLEKFDKMVTPAILITNCL